MQWQEWKSTHCAVIAVQLEIYRTLLRKIRQYSFNGTLIKRRAASKVSENYVCAVYDIWILADLVVVLIRLSVKICGIKVDLHQAEAQSSSDDPLGQTS